MRTPDENLAFLSRLEPWRHILAYFLASTKRLSFFRSELCNYFMWYIQSEAIHICSLFCPIVLFLSKRWTGFGKRRSERLSVSLGNNKTSIYVSRIAALVRHPRNSRTDALQLAGARVTTLCRLCLWKYFWHCAFEKIICWTWFSLDLMIKSGGQ